MVPNDKKAFIDSILRDFPKSSHLNHSICEKCGGKCCQRGGCGLMTCDVSEMSVDGIRRMLDTGKYSITFFFAGMEEIIPVMSAREVNAERVNNSIIRRPCSLQQQNGCSFSDEERPTMGLLYVPNSQGNCEMLVDSLELAFDWYPCKELMEQVVLLETGKNTTELFYNGCINAAMQIRQKLDQNLELTETEEQALLVLDLTGIIMLLEE